MAKIQTLKNQDGVIIYPQTHTRAVFDKNGTDLQTVLDGLTDEIGDKQVHYFNLTSTSNKEVAQEAYDDFLAGNFPIVIYDDQYYYSQRGNSIHHVFATSQVRQLNWGSFDTLGNSYLFLDISEGQVTSIQFEGDGDHEVRFISTLKQETDEAFMPTYNAHPATKAYVDQTIAANLGEGAGVSMEVVDTRPEVGEAGKIYLVPNEDGTHTEYIYIEGADGAAGTWETIGTTDVDLTNYATKEYAESLANVEIIYFNDFNQTAENNEKATQAFEAYLSGKEVLLNCEGEIYELNSVTDTGYMSFLTRKIGNLGNTYTAGDSSTRTTLSLKQVNIQGLGPGNAEFRGTSTQLIATINYLSPNNDYATPYMPEFDGSPATKKYVDDTIAEALENNGGSATEDVVKFTLSGTESVDELQPIVDAYKAGKIVQIEKVGDDYIYTLERANDRLLSFTRPNVDYKDDEGVVVLGEKSIIIFTNEETGVVEDASLNGGLETATVIDASSYSTAEPFIPTNDNQPTSKKYVDDAIASALTGTGGERAFFTFDKKFHELLNEDLQPVVDAHREGKVVEIHMPIEEERFGFQEGTFTVTYAGENQLILSNDLIMTDDGAGAITLDNESYIIDISNTGEIIMIGAASPKQAFLSTINGSYETMFTPTEGWQPATKQYADDRIADAALDLQEYVNNTIADAMPETGVSFEVTSTRPETGADGIIYLVPNGDGTHTEYMYINNNWETIGSTEADLTNYATKTYVDNASITLFTITDTDSSTSKYRVLDSLYKAHLAKKAVALKYVQGQAAYFFRPGEESETLGMLNLNSMFGRSVSSSTGASANTLQTSADRIELTIDVAAQEVTNFRVVWSDSRDVTGNYLATDIDYSTPYIPLYDGSPATKAYVDDAVANAVGGVGTEIVEGTLPTTGEEGKIYLVPNDNGGYTENIYVNGKWEPIGDMTGYATEEYVNNLIPNLDDFVIAEDVAELEGIVSQAEVVSNKVTEINENSTDVQYPSAKAVYEALQNVSAGDVNLDNYVTKPEFELLSAAHDQLDESFHDHTTFSVTDEYGVHSLRYDATNNVFEVLNPTEFIWEAKATIDYNKLINKPDVYTKAEIDEMLGTYETNMLNLLEGNGISE